MRNSGLIAALALALVLLSAAAAPADVSQTTIMVGVHGNMQAQLFVPDGPGPYPGMLVLHTSGGLRDADLTAAKQLANEGYVCLVPAFMAAYGITYDSRRDTFNRDGDTIFADLVDAAGALQRNPKVQGGSVGALGFSNGGYFAVWLALTGNVRAAVSYYGAYSGAGSDIAQTRFKKLAGPTAAPILILHGLGDDTVPVGAARLLAGILGGSHATYEMQLYPDTGHSFDRSNSGGDRNAAADAWARTLAFFRKYLH